MAASGDLGYVRAALLKHYSIQVKHIEALDAGSTPNHHVVAQDGTEFLVKALYSRLGQWVVENARQITALAAHASSHGLATPAPVLTTSSALTVCEPGPPQDEETHFVVFEWAVGFQRADHFVAASPSDADSVFCELGELLARLHALPTPSDIALSKADAPGGHALCDMGSFLECASDVSSLYKGHDTADAMWFRSWLPRLVKFWTNLPDGEAMCHGDAYLDNVLVKTVEGAGLQLMLIDWEDSCVTHPVVDLAACAVGTCFTLSLDEGSADVEVELVTTRFRSLLAGYARGRVINSAEQLLLRPAMQVCAWACGAFRYGRFLEGVADVKTRNYGQLVRIVEILDGMDAGKFEELAFSPA
mmetsp:Transcript_9743/g.18811  ORF Transcript_9743/g.18811 Transcript_9743/m.18811 type:complete len:360 (-) Transcript_9743:127-1206(-)